ncbi:hypothetical protein [Facilibium subflavum]|uniref:hypothetical protein n=1 Tax=Facilibium subflavum TaxID=2219058 RepID=UPI000E651B06|nr:hypothetical protein [Facilibium subflavum]
MEYLQNSFTGLYINMSILISVLSVIVHIVCALGVSKDLGNFHKRNIAPQLMPNFAWVLTVLVTGVWGFLIYWLMHHSSLSR